MKTRWIAGLMGLALSSGLLFASGTAAHAGSKGRRNTMYALGAAAAYSLLKGKTTQGLIAGAGTAYAYKKYKDARDDEQRYDEFDSTRRSNGSPYRTRDAGGDFQFPDTYYDGGPSTDVGYRNGGSQYQNGKSGQFLNGGQYQYGGGEYRYDNGQYQGGKSGSYTTDERGNRQYDGNRYQQRRYRSRYVDDRPRGWSRGQKRGWQGRSVPPGQRQR